MAMTSRIGRMATAAAIATGCLIAAAIAAQEGQVVFSEKSQSGQLWANLALTYLRVNEPYLPLVIGVQNFSEGMLVVDRSSFRLIGPDGVRYPMADLKILRTSYDKASLDRRIASASGIPVDLWARQRRLRESNFFPDVGLSRRPTVINQVTLAPRDGMADLVYFVTPPGLAPGKPFVLEVQPRDWSVPLRLRLILG